MGRHAEGWKIVWRNGIAYVRFRHKGTRVDRSTGERDKGAATTRAEDIYARWLRGAPVPRRKISATMLSLEDLFFEWIASLHGVLSPGTIETNEIYCAHLLAFFRDLDSITTPAVREYSQERLAKVQRKTLRKELSALRSFLAWADEGGFLRSVPHVPTPARTAMGTVQIKRKSEPVAVTSAQAEKIIAACPEWSRRIHGKRVPVRAFIRMLWETGLRPSTVHRIEVPKHWAPGSRHLEIEAKNDKARFGRKIALTPAAVSALTAAWENGRRGERPFGRDAARTDYRKTLRKAAERCRLPRASSLTLYDFRHARALDVLDKTADLPGAAFMLGHKQLTTTNKYLHPGESAGDRVVRAISKPKKPAKNNMGGKRVKGRKR